jgi:hypothetical protein
MEIKPKSKTADAGLAPMDVQTRPHGSPLAPTRPTEPRKEPESEREFDPLRFGVTELPAGMRQNLIATKLPLVPADQLFDTHPPNKPIPAVEREHAPTARDLLPAADAPDSVKLPLRSWRTLVIGGVAVVVLLVGAVIIARSPAQPTATAPSAPSDTPSDTPTATASSAPPPSQPTAIVTAKPTAPNAAPIVSARPPEPVRAHDAKASEGVARPRQNTAPKLRESPSPPPPATPKAGGLDAAEFPKPD